MKEATIAAQNGAGAKYNLDGPSSQAAYRDLFLRSMDAILLVDIGTGTIIESNDASEGIFRLPMDRLDGTSVYDYCHDDSLAEFRKMIRIASRRYHPKSFEVKMTVGPERKIIIAEMAGSPLQLSDKTEVLQLIFRDITEKKEAERKIAEYIKTIEEMAITDGMTGLTNFREFARLIEIEHKQCSRYGGSYAIIFTDMDNFKHYNDTNGHPAGDSLLRHFAKVLKDLVRDTDIPARYGGEEFVILCPHTDTDEASILAERIRDKIASTPFPHSEKQPLGIISISIGVSSFPMDGDEWKEVMKAADNALYLSKENGRNRVTRSLGASRLIDPAVRDTMPKI